MLFMVIETFERDDMVPIYRHIRDHGRQLPEGLEYVDSWIEPGFRRCFQIMRTDDARTLQAWSLQFRGLGARFEIVPVVPSAETRQVVAPFLEAGLDKLTGVPARGPAQEMPGVLAHPGCARRGPTRL